MKPTLVYTFYSSNLEDYGITKVAGIEKKALSLLESHFPRLVIRISDTINNTPTPSIGKAVCFATGYEEGIRIEDEAENLIEEMLKSEKGES